jgi:hypothetical protein
MGLLTDFQLVQFDAERNKDDPIIIELQGTRERRAGGKQASTLKSTIGVVRGVVTSTRTRNMVPGEDGVRFRGATEFQVVTRDLLALGITEKDTKDLKIFKSNMVFRVAGPAWLARERIARLFCDRTRDAYPALEAVWDFEDDTIGEEPANCTITVPEDVPDFEWHALGNFTPPVGSRWAKENFVGTEVAVVENQTYGGAVHRMLRLEWPGTDDGQAATFTPSSKDVTEEISFSFDFMVMSDSSGWQHFCKFYNGSGVLVAEIDQGGVSDLSVMMFPDGFQPVIFTPTLTFAKGKYYRLTYIIYDTKHHRLNVHCYDDGTDHVGDLKDNDDWTGWAINNISTIKFNRQTDTQLKYRLADIEASWSPSTGGSVLVASDGTHVTAITSSYMGASQVAINVLDVAEGPAATVEFDIKITGADSDGIVSRIVLGEITDIDDLDDNILLYMVIERVAGVLHLKDFTGLIFDTTITASSWVHVKVSVNRNRIMTVTVGSVDLVDDIDVSGITAAVEFVLFTGYAGSAAVVKIDNVEVDCVAR